jgi:hypothetical protein
MRARGLKQVIGSTHQRIVASWLKSLAATGWGYDRIAGALNNLGHCVSDQTVGNILRRFGIAPAPKRRQQLTWADFIRSHMAVLAGIDFFTVEVLSWRGLVTYYVLFFLHLETRRVILAGVTRHPTEEWMVQMARNAVDAIDGALLPIRFALHDRNRKFSLLSSHATLRRHSRPDAAGPQPESECLRRALGALHKGRVLVKAHPVR